MNPGIDPKRMKTGIMIKVPLRADAPVAAVAPVTPAGSATGALPGTTVSPVAPPSLPPAPPVPFTVAEKTYIVQAGDTLSGIARSQLGSASQVGALKTANADVLKGSDMIRKGMSLRIPGASSSTATAKVPAPVVEVASGATTGAKSYTVASGDTLSSIASRMLGSSSRYREIVAANEALLHGSDKLKPGMKLVIPSDVLAK